MQNMQPLHPQWVQSVLPVHAFVQIKLDWVSIDEKAAHYSNCCFHNLLMQQVQVLIYVKTESDFYKSEWLLAGGI